MKTVLILGAGTAGTAMAHKLRRKLSSEWDVAVVDPSTKHLYQPGLLFLPFGDETEARIVDATRALLAEGGLEGRSFVQRTALATEGTPAIFEPWDVRALEPADFSIVPDEAEPGENGTVDIGRGSNGRAIICCR